MMRDYHEDAYPKTKDVHKSASTYDGHDCETNYERQMHDLHGAICNLSGHIEGIEQKIFGPMPDHVSEKNLIEKPQSSFSRGNADFGNSMERISQMFDRLARIATIL